MFIFFPLACVVQHMRSNGTRLVYPCAETEVDCFYTGRADNFSDSWVSATVCGGLVSYRFISKVYATKATFAR